MNSRKKNEEQLSIEVVDARTNNLRGLSVQIPHRKMTVVTGLSGSGKSSLAFDTIYAEGQRRYVETLSTYARQFLQQMRRPPVGAVRNIPPSLALRQGNSVNNARSTVGTLTELTDHLQVLFASAGIVICRCCGARVRTWNVHDIVGWLRENVAGERVLVLGTVVPADEDDRTLVLRQLAAEGHRRFYVAGETIEIDSPDAAVLLSAPRWSVIVDRIRVDSADSRLVEAVEAAARFGEGGVEVILWDREVDGVRPTRRFPAAWRCADCDTQHHAPVPQLFHAQSQIGACAICQGFGRTVGIDEGRVVPDPRKTIEDGAVVCFQTPSYRPMQARLVKLCMAAGIPIDVPWLALRAEDRRFVMRGRGREWTGIDGFFDAMGEDRYKPHVRIFLARFRGYTECAMCAGSGLSDNARAVRVDGRHMGELLELRIDQALAWADGYVPAEDRGKALDPLLREIRDRLRYLADAGVGYLTLARHARTLSGGEMHRVLLATSVGRMLTDTCYVLDEPTAGLHPHDTERLLGVIERLRDAGNTLVVVEHDPDVIARADYVLEIGPGAGEHGGNLVFAGDVKGLRTASTITGAALSARRLAPTDAPRPAAWLTLRHACLNNLRDVSVTFPVGGLSVVTGVSGSGKSTLINDVLHQKLLESRGERSGAELGPATVEGPAFNEIVMVDQGSVARSSRSCALTFSGAYTPIRELFAAQPTALAHAVGAGDFSFNTPGGRCERCEGTGVIDVEMHFIADIELPCDVCDGRRFKEQILAVRVAEKSIHDVFEMTIDEAAAFFADRAPIVRRLEPLQRVGLGYLRLGQSTSRLSGGELQRLKLASYVGGANAASDGQKLFLFDEPTVGLHMRDVDRLVGAMRELSNAGHTVIVVEHNLDLVAQCDWVVDLGPGAGPDGGSVVYEGPVSGLAASTASLTARHLRATFGS